MSAAITLSLWWFRLTHSSTAPSETTVDALRPGDWVTFGDHTGSHRVRAVSWDVFSEPCLAATVVRFWFRPARLIREDQPVWVYR